MTRTWIDTLWPIALLIVFVVSFRRPTTETARAEPVQLCEAREHDLRALESCVDAEPRNVELLTDLGDAYRQAGDGGRAEAAYRRALAVDPADGDVHLRLGRLLLDHGDRHAAAVEAQAALQSQPGNEDGARLLDAASERR